MDARFETISSPDGNLLLELAPSVGGGVTRFVKKGPEGFVDLFRPYDKATELSPLNFSNFALTPFSNRIGYGKLAFQGAVYDVNTPFKSGDHPNHGDGWMLPWAVKDKTENRIEIVLDAKGAPYTYQSSQVFELGDDGLIITISILNKSGRALPFGTGHHAYFPRNDQTVLKASLSHVWQSQNMLPTKLVPVPDKWSLSQGLVLSDANLAPAGAGDDGSAYMDHCFQGWNQVAEIRWPDKKMALEMSADPIFENFVIYIPSGQNFFCAEPVTNITDGFNLMEKGVADTGTIVLNDGQKLSGTVTFKPRVT